MRMVDKGRAQHKQRLSVDIHIAEKFLFRMSAVIIVFITIISQFKVLSVFSRTSAEDTRH
jgi:hypothetical protein